MSDLFRVRTIVAGCVTALVLAGCGGGGGGGGSASVADPVPVGTTPPAPANPAPLPLPPSAPESPATPGAPAATGNIAVDGREWLNFRRGQVGMSTLVQSTTIDIAAQGHSDYQRINNTITHDQIAGRQGFTGIDVKARLEAAGYRFNTNASRAFGEVISAAGNNSGQYMAEELITAVYHRFVIFEPIFKEIGTGAATTGAGYNYFTTNFTANNGYGAGLPGGQVAVWPFSDQTTVPRNFFSNTEQPDPVPDLNEVGYPISVHANIDLTIRVTSFTVRPRGGAELAVRLLSNANDIHTGSSSAAIVPLAPLAANTVYDVSFTGSTNVINAAGVVVSTTPVTRAWSFTTR
ncbi:CAP domain-containing protein [Massilia sp. CMS3.1]|uniref:CAP domain-containing protein n=1 Tax=Massilia sp. CMS3.1 TaxID=3373083 RepID=UPI003EE43576